MAHKSINDFKFLVGSSLKEANTKIIKPYHIRLVTIDGKDLALTRDLNFHRINVVVEKGLINEIKDLG